MPLSWNEINTRAASFVNEWKDKAASAREKAEAAEFMSSFLNIFGSDGEFDAATKAMVTIAGQERLTGFWQKPEVTNQNGRDLWFTIIMLSTPARIYLGSTCCKVPF